MELLNEAMTKMYLDDEEWEEFQTGECDMNEFLLEHLLYKGREGG